MRRLRLIFLVFSLALLAPIALLVDRALRSVTLERQVRHQTVAERVFDEMERGLSRLLEREEQRPFEQYNQPAIDAEPPAFPFVIGYFQIDPNGDTHTLPAPGTEKDAAIEGAVISLSRGRGGMSAQQAPAQGPGTTVELDKGALAPAAPEARDQKVAKNEVSAFDALRSLNKAVQERTERQKKATEYASTDSPAAVARSDEAAVKRAAPPLPARAAAPAAQDELLDSARSAVELAPMTGRSIDNRHLLLSRTVVRDRQAYRQGVLVDTEQLADWLRAQGLGSDGGLATYATVSFKTPFAIASAPVAASGFTYEHRFAEPFADLSARLVLRPLPGVGSVTYVYALCALLLATGVLGLAALYRMVSVVVSFAERRSNFVAAVSHELKTPLTAIRMYGEMLRDGMVPTEAKRSEYYRHITVEAERLSRLINNVLEFSRLENGTREVAPAVGSVAPVVREVAELLRAHVEEHGFELRIEVDPDLPPIRFERDALMQVLWNLVDNAVKYAYDASSKQIVLRAWSDGGGVHISVRDRGPGVPARHLGEIFEPFYRGESELTRRSKGTGLGLALVRGLVERMGGRVSGHNVADGGFEVEIVFRSAAG